MTQNSVAQSDRRMVVGLFDNLLGAGQAVEDVIAIGIPGNQVSLVACEDAIPGGSGHPVPADGASSGSGVLPRGHVTGGPLTGEADANVLRSRLEGLRISPNVLSFTDIGRAVTTGPLAAILRRALGARTLASTLIQMGLPGADAQWYAERIRLGGTLVIVPVGSDPVRLRDVRALLNYSNAVGVHQRADEAEGGDASEDEVALRSDVTAGGDTAHKDADEVHQEVHEGELEVPRSPVRWSQNDSRPESWEPGEAMVKQFAPFSSEFHEHFDVTYASLPGARYEDFAPAYYYGVEYGLRAEEEASPDHEDEFAGRSKARTWEEVASAAQAGWDAARYGQWEHFREAVRFGWETAAIPAR